MEKPTTENDQMLTRSQKVIALIQKFDTKLKGNLKAGEMITADSAVWNMEASLNYNYAIPDSSAASFLVKRSFYTIGVDANHMVSMDDVTTVYGQMDDTLNIQYNGITNPVKHVAFSDVTMDSVVEATGYLSVATGFGLDLPRNYVPFAEDDDWIWGTLGSPLAGKCDGTEIGVSDGSNELQWRLNNPMPVPEEQIYGYTDIVTEYATGMEYTDSNGNPRLYIDYTGTINACIENNDLTYYLGQSDDIIYTYQDQGGERPTGKDFIKVEITDEVIVDYENSTYLHFYKIRYGIPYYVPPPD